MLGQQKVAGLIRRGADGSFFFEIIKLFLLPPRLNLRREAVGDVFDLDFLNLAFIPVCAFAFPRSLNFLLLFCEEYPEAPLIPFIRFRTRPLTLRTYFDPPLDLLHPVILPVLLPFKNFIFLNLR